MGDSLDIYIELIITIMESSNQQDAALRREADDLKTEISSCQATIDSLSQELDEKKRSLEEMEENIHRIIKGEDPSKAETLGDTKDDTSHAAPSSKKPRYDYLSKKMIEQFHPGDGGQIPYHLIGWWKRIFELLAPPHYDPTTHTDRIHLRCLCNMFNAALKPPPKGMKGKWTEFPHPNHPSLESLIARCHQLYDEDPRRAPTIIFIKEGNHEV